MKSYKYMYLWSVWHDDQTTIKDYHFVTEGQLFWFVRQKWCPGSGLEKGPIWQSGTNQIFLLQWAINFLRFLAQWERVQMSHPLTKSVTLSKKEQNVALDKQNVRAVCPKDQLECKLFFFFSSPVAGWLSLKNV